jgi:orotidine-5'-phosphate decarboxylase
MQKSQLLKQFREVSMGNRIITALDMPTAEQAVSLASGLGENGQFVKVGMQLFTASGPKVISDLHDANRSIFLDLKYMDIPNTVAGGVRSACGLGVSMLTIHASGGKRMMEAAAEAASEFENRAAILAVTVLTSFTLAELDEVAPGGGDMNDRIKRLATVSLEAGCDGLICSPPDLPAIRSAVGDEMLVITPGVRPVGSAGDDQRRVATPKGAISDGADYLVIGRPITKSDNPGIAIKTIAEELV